MIDVYDGQAFLVVGYYFADKGDHENGPFYHDLYISDVYGTRFQLSLRDIGYISSHFDGQKLLEWVLVANFQKIIHKKKLTEFPFGNN